MKKLLLLLTILNYSIINADNVSGYITFDSKYSHKLKEFRYFTNNKIVTENLKTPEKHEFSNVLDLGVYVGKNKENMIFTGIDYKNIGELKNNQYNIINNTKAYIGSRFDNKINKDINYSLFIAYNKDYKDKKVFENAIINHLKAKDEHNESRYKSEKTDYLLENGYYEKFYNNKQAMFSGVVDSNIRKKTKLHFGDVLAFNEDNKKYNIDNILFLKTNTKIDSKKNLKTDFRHILTNKNYKHLGSISGNVKINSKLNNKTILDNNINLELKNILPITKNKSMEKEYNLLLKFDNKLDYDFDKNSKITLEMNYKQDALISPLSETFEDKSKKIIIENDASELKHNIVNKVSYVYKNNNFKSNLKLENKFDIKHNLGEIKIDGVKKEKIENLSNRFTVDSNLSYKLDDIHLDLDSKYIINSGENLKNDFLIGPKISYIRNRENVNINTYIDFKYLSETKPKLITNHHFFLNSLIDVKFKLNDFNQFDFKTQFFNYNNLFTNNFVLDKKQERLTLLEQDIKYVNDNRILKTTLSTNLQFLNYERKNNDSIIIKTNPKTEKVLKDIIDNSLKLRLNSEFRFKAQKTMDFVIGLNNTYSYNFLQDKHFQIYKEFIQNNAFIDGDFRYSRDNIMSSDEYAKKTKINKDYEKENPNIFKNNEYVVKRNTTHSLRVNPKISIVKRINKFQIIPYVEGILDFREFAFTTPEYRAAKTRLDNANKNEKPGSPERKKAKENFDREKIILNESQKFSLKLFEGRIGLNAKYEW